MATYSTHTLYTRNKKEMQRPRTVMKNRDFVLWKTAIIWRSVPTSLDVLAVAALLTACSVLQQLAAHLYLLSLLQLMHSTDLACTALNSTVLYRCALQIVWYNALNCSCCTVSSYLVRGRDPLSIKDCGCQQGCISKIIIVLSLSFSSISSSSSSSVPKLKWRQKSCCC